MQVPEKNCEANTLAMLFEAHRSLLIDFFGLNRTKTAKNDDNGPHVHIPINNETQIVYRPQTKQSQT